MEPVEGKRAREPRRAVERVRGGSLGIAHVSADAASSSRDPRGTAGGRRTARPRRPRASRSVDVAKPDPSRIRAGGPTAAAGRAPAAGRSRRPPLRENPRTPPRGSGRSARDAGRARGAGRCDGTAEEGRRSAVRSRWEGAIQAVTVPRRGTSTQAAGSIECADKASCRKNTDLRCRAAAQSSGAATANFEDSRRVSHTPDGHAVSQGAGQPRQRSEVTRPRQRESRRSSLPASPGLMAIAQSRASRVVATFGTFVVGYGRQTERSGRQAVPRRPRLYVTTGNRGAAGWRARSPFPDSTGGGRGAARPQWESASAAVGGLGPTASP